MKTPAKYIRKPTGDLPIYFKLDKINKFIVINMTYIKIIIKHR